MAERPFMHYVSDCKIGVPLNGGRVRKRYRWLEMWCELGWVVYGGHAISCDGA